VTTGIPASAIPQCGSLPHPGRSGREPSPTRSQPQPESTQAEATSVSSSPRLAIGFHYLSARGVHVKKTGRPEREGATSSDRPHTRSGQERAGSFEFVSGANPCLDYLASELAKHAKSADIFRHQRTELSKSPSGASQRSSGPTTPRLGLPHSPSVMCEQPVGGFQARSTRPLMSGPSCSPLRLIQTDLCGND
jgi:hypothetical protein